ncbi:MAG: exo-alpha-sialidase [Candidatus Latescibacterota bacterium]
MTGIAGITKNKAALSVLPNTPAGELWRYGGGGAIQLAPGKAAFFAGIWVEGKGSIDFVNGSDLVLFDVLSDIRPDQAIPISRSEFGESSVAIKGTVVGGFVPLGAKLEDGSPHPHAGTGFGQCYALRYALRYPLDPDGHYDYSKPSESWLEFYQFAYTGEKFRIVSKERTNWSTLFPNCEVVGEGLTYAIPDGEDLLLAVTGKIGEELVDGVSRWRVGEDGWRPVSFVPVTGSKPDDKGQWVCGGEPSVVRDREGSLLFSARSADEANFDMAVWRSSDAGQTWRQIIYRKNCRSRSPISLNRAADGTPYIAANLPSNCRTREVLALWPLNDDRTDFEKILIARDCRAEFGFAPSGSWWRVDHPRSAVVQLSDGGWHDLLIYQIADNMEIEGDADMAPQTGHYVEEVFSKGEAIPAWRF